MERLHMNYLRDVIYRLRARESDRQIARDLHLSRSTVRKYREWADEQGFLDADQPLPDQATLAAALGPTPRPPVVASSVEPYHEIVLRLLEQGVEMTAIFQRLQEDYDYKGSYSSVRRYVHRLQPAAPEAFVRVHTEPGQEAQVDFGHVGQLYDPSKGKPRTAYAFVATLSYSRHQYAELVFDQKVPTWIALHQRAFASWGGVPQRVVPDNLRAAVAKVLIHDPVLGEAYRRLAQHYGFFVSPTRPYKPQHKGKVENGIHYLKRNFMAGQQFADIHAANQRLWTWVRERAGTRQHGTTHQPPLYLFQTHEQAALLPLPAEPFTLCEIKVVKVHPDCHVTIAGSYYSVPYSYVGKTLEAYVSERVVELFDQSDLVATHERSRKPGQWLTRLEHYPPEKAAYLQQNPTYCRQVAARLGPATSQLVETLLQDRPLDRLRTVQAILRLERTVGPQRLEAACARALHFGTLTYRSIKTILNAAMDREPLPESAVQASQQTFTFARPAHEFFTSPQEVES
jgi:transposase